MTVRPELAAWYEQVDLDLAALSRALGPPIEQGRLINAGRRALAALGKAAPGPAREEQTIARLQIAIAELVNAAWCGDDDGMRFALRWVTESISALGSGRV